MSIFADAADAADANAMLSGRVNAGYRIRDGKWLEIGRMSPQKPQVHLLFRLLSLGLSRHVFSSSS